MTNFETVTIIANQLANNGKKPTVALIKAKLATPVPLPQIISTLKSWQHEPENCTFPAPEVAEQSNDEESVENKSVVIPTAELQAIIEQAIAPLKQELADIKALLKK